MGEADGGPRGARAGADAIGLPPEVEANVRRFASRLAPARKRRGLTLELTAGPDININRSTTSPFIDTIIAPFELSEDARRIGGVRSDRRRARSIRATPIGPLTLLTRVNGRADLYDKSRFNDVQLSRRQRARNSRIGKLRLRPVGDRRAALVRRRPLRQGHRRRRQPARPAVAADRRSNCASSRVKQDIAPQPRPGRLADQLRRSASPRSSARARPAQVALRHARLDARFKPESVRLWGGSAAARLPGQGGDPVRRSRVSRDPRASSPCSCSARSAATSAGT